jgi:periplasmic copper chaperone A
MNRTTIAVAAAVAAALTLPAAAQAHVTLQPTQAPTGGFARLDVRVPSEEDAKNTIKVEVQMPPGFSDASYQPVAGWNVTETRHKLAKPIKADDGDLLTDELATITWTAASGKGLKPGQFQDFGLSLGLPDKPAGTKLTFKALQTYTGGEVVRWIGAPGSEHPAPQVTLVADTTASTTAAAPAPAASADDSDSDSGSGNGLAIVALIVGALGLIAGGAALAASRKGKAA